MLQECYNKDTKEVIKMKKFLANKLMKSIFSAILLASILFGQSSLILAQETIHIVSHGEILYQIAQKYGVTVKDLQTWNQLTSNVIYTGDRLIVSEPLINYESSPISGTYKVKAGDSLYKIANMHGITVNQLKAWNGLSSNLIQIGQNLLVIQPLTPAPEPTKPIYVDGVYTVQNGDYLYKIANMYGVTVDQLKAWNGLSSSLIQIGQKLVVVQPTSPAPTPSPISTANIHIVKTGDTIYQIARKYGVTENQVRHWNRLTTHLIFPNDKLIVSQPTTTTTYIVQPGDYLLKIASKYGVTVNQIKSWNKLTSDKIYVGDKIIIKN